MERVEGGSPPAAPAGDGPAAGLITPQLDPATAFATVAHELRAPIQALLLNTELLADEFETLPPARHRAVVESLRRQALWAQALLENLLSAAALREGRLHLHLRPVLLAELLAEIEPVVRPLLAQRHQELRVTGVAAGGAATDLKVMADPLRLGQVLINLLHNASKYGPPAAPIDVVVGAGDAGGAGGAGDAGRECPPGFVRVVVADRGAGVPPGGAARLFLPFGHAVPDAERVDTEVSTATVKGVGLGLSIVRSIVEAHGGRIGVDDRPGGGAAFWFEVPAAPNEAREPQPQTSPLV